MPVDATGTMEGVEFVGATGLGQTLHDSESAAACAVRNLFRYAIGRNPGDGEAAFLRGLEGQFAEAGYRFPELMRVLAMSDPFRTTSGPRVSDSLAGDREEAI